MSSSSPTVSSPLSKPPRICIHDSTEDHVPLILPVVASPPSSASSPSVFSPVSVADTISTTATSPRMSSRRASKSSTRKRSLSPIDAEHSNMPSRTSRQSSVCSASSKKSSTPNKKEKPLSTEDTDWSAIKDPDERRRMQNRLAQRKFREKARENKEKAERDARNQEHAGNCYRTATAEDFAAADADGFSGLPWGGMSLGLVMAKSHEAESRRSSGQGTYAGESSSHSGHGSVHNMSYTPTRPTSAHHSPTHETPIMQPAQLSHHVPRGSFGSNLGDDLFLTEPQYMYEPPPLDVVTSYPMMR